MNRSTIHITRISSKYTSTERKGVPSGRLNNKDTSEVPTVVLKVTMCAPERAVQGYSTTRIRPKTAICASALRIVDNRNGTTIIPRTRWRIVHGLAIAARERAVRQKALTTLNRESSPYGSAASRPNRIFRIENSAYQPECTTLRIAVDVAESASNQRDSAAVGPG
jgi:hypothetical protein